MDTSGTNGADRTGAARGVDGRRGRGGGRRCGRMAGAVSWLRSATAPTGEAVDVEILDGVIRRVQPAAGDPVGPDDTDLSGHVLLASFVEPHAHLDKALTASLVHNPTGDLAGA